MKRPERVQDYLKHIAQVIDRATSYLRPLQTFEAFEQDNLSQDAVVRNIEITGEAVNQIQRMDPGFLLQNPDIPWAEMRRIRNVVIHEYSFSILRSYGLL